MTLPAPAPPHQLPLGVERKDGEVNVAEIHASLLGFLAIAGKLHLWLFDKQLIVTSANDGKHAQHSKHYRSRAVDLRSRDKSDEEQTLFGALLAYLAPKRHVKIFDERAREDAPHWHVETVD